MSISASIQAISNAACSMFEAIKTYIANQSTLEVVKDKKSLKRASNYTEELINEIRQKAREYDDLFAYSMQVFTTFLSEEEVKVFSKKVKHARNSRKTIRLIRKIEKLD